MMKRSDLANSGWCCPFDLKGRDDRVKTGEGKAEYSLGQPRNAIQCIAGCRSKFLESLALEDEYITLLCDALTTDQSEEALWSLYCCDYNSCGVWIDTAQGPGQDRKYSRQQNIPLLARVRSN